MVAVLFKGGDHDPLIPLLDVVGSALIELPLQTGPTELKEGVVGGETVIVNVDEVAHCPMFGVNVCIMVPEIAVEIDTGLQVPLIPSFDCCGKMG